MCENGFCAEHVETKKGPAVRISIINRLHVRQERLSEFPYIGSEECLVSTFGDLDSKIEFFFASPGSPLDSHKRDGLVSVLHLLRRELIDTAGYDPDAGDDEAVVDSSGVRRRLFASLILMFTGIDLLAKFHLGDSGGVGDRFKKFLKDKHVSGSVGRDADLFYAIRSSLVHAFGMPDSDALQKLKMKSIAIAHERVVMKGGGLLVVQTQDDVAIIYVDGVFRSFRFAAERYHESLYGSGSDDARAMFEQMFDKYGTIYM
jgi:hypothetical protein